ncbi:MAG: hypothetical protein SGI73_10900, partial [Chloroflexota bacterium]|nr:hypothetical protein [Chloroflexota bacterium]
MPILDIKGCLLCLLQDGKFSESRIEVTRIPKWQAVVDRNAPPHVPKVCEHVQEAHEARCTAAARGVCGLNSGTSWLGTLT